MSLRLNRKLLLGLSSLLLLGIVGGSLWLDQQIKTSFRDFSVFAQVYNPPPPPPPPPGSPLPPPGGGTCPDGSCGIGETSSNCPQDCTEGCDVPCNEDEICCSGSSCTADSEQACWPNLPPGDPGNSPCGSTYDCTISCSCPVGYNCELVCGSDGCYSDCCRGGSCTDVPGGPGGGCSHTYPNRPVLAAPANGGTEFTPTIDLSWNGIASWGTNCYGNTNNYAVYVDYYSPPQTQLCWNNSGTTTCSISNDASHAWLFEPGRTYYWRVVATNGALTSTSDTWSYTMGGGISGTVYEDSSIGACSTATTLGSGNWTVTCDSIAAQESGATFTCQDASGKTALTEGQHTIGYSAASSDYIFSCNSYGSQSVTLGATTPNVTNYNLMFTQAREAWFQTRGGDLFADYLGSGDAIQSQIPETCSGACSPYLALPDLTTLQPGSVSRASGTQSYGSGEVSAEGWQAQAGSYGGIQADYDFWLRHLSDKLTEQDITSDPGEGFWLATNIGGTLTISANWNVAAGEQVVLLYDGNIQVNANQTVAEGGSLMIVASGSISFAASLTNAQGIYIANTISTGTTGGSNDVALRGEGTFIGWSGISLQRDLGFNNHDTAAELFVYRPDIVYNLPSEVKRPFYTWREVP